jgi:hypothetical protein
MPAGERHPLPRLNDFGGLFQYSHHLIPVAQTKACERDAGFGLRYHIDA